ncbi:MAG: bifunctional methylenetetrahydrofolate dehydrogenase/methenyltetrahydrofolate cyclohydrolase FolD [Caulobacterales bacterium]
MAAALIDGNKISAEWRGRAAEAAAELAPRLGRTPCLAVVLVGEDPASQVYVRNKNEKTHAAGMRSVEIKLPATIGQAELEARVTALSADDSVDGILVQLPLPKGLESNRVLACLDPAKDVDGLTVQSAGRLLAAAPGLRPCTPAGAVILAKHALGSLSGKNCVVLGRSLLVGKTAALLFLAEDCTISIAHSRTKDLPALCRSADILVAAIGKPNFVRGDWVKPGACVIDVGINRVEPTEPGGKAKLTGDVNFAEASQVAGSITPVPGGVGPMTIACLLRNTVIAAAMRKGLAVPSVLDV